MSDMNWKTWLLMVIVAIGVIFQILKHLPMDSQVGLWSKEGLNFSFGNSQPYNVKVGLLNIKPVHKSTAPRARFQIPVQQLNQFIAANTPQKTEFEHSKPKGAEGKKVGGKKKDEDEWEYFTDPVTGKKYRRRKKKAKVADSPTATAPKPTSPAPSDSSDDTGSAGTTLVGGSGFESPAVPQTPVADVDEWTRRLLTQPDAKMTQLFIQQYQQGLVSSDIFYKVAQLMLDDPRTEMKSLGALCAGMTPS